jgi:hypothetical protein
MDFYTLLEQIRSEELSKREGGDVWGFTLLFKAINSLTEDNESPLAVAPVSL